MSLDGWERRAKRVLTRALSQVLRARGAAPPLPDLRDLRSVLLVRHHNQLGDMLLATPVFRAVRRRAPSARIDLVAGPENHDAVRGNAHLDEVLLYDKAAYRRRPLAGKRFVERLRDARYDLVIAMTTVAFSQTGAWIAALSGARLRLGRLGPDGDGRREAEGLFHWMLPAADPSRHQTGVNLDVVGPLGAPTDDWRPEIFLAREEAEAGRELLEQAIGGGDRLRIVIHPGAGKILNRWPAERFGEVARALVEGGHRVVTAAGPKETNLLERLDRGAGRPLPRIPACGVRVLGGTLKEADLVLANDTGVLHLGAAVGTPVLALFGPTDPAIWCPAAPAVRWLRAPGGDLSRLAADDVITAALGLADALAGRGEMPSGLAAAPERAP
jgi:ADP-heptose:LPS heptosyltransferase